MLSNKTIKNAKFFEFPIYVYKIVKGWLANKRPEDPTRPWNLKFDMEAAVGR